MPTTTMLFLASILLLSYMIQCYNALHTTSYTFHSLSVLLKNKHHSTYDIRLHAKRKNNKSKSVAETNDNISSIKSIAIDELNAPVIPEVDIQSKISMDAKIKEEISSPFRKLRQFIYISMGMAAGLGSITGVPQLMLTLQDKSIDLISSAALVNTAINVGGIIGSILLWDLESKSEKAKVARFTEKERLQIGNRYDSVEITNRNLDIKSLAIKIIFSEQNSNVTKVTTIDELQSKGKQNAILFAGNQEYLKDCLISARIEGSALFNAKETYLIPYDINVDVAAASTDDINDSIKKGFGALSKDGDGSSNSIMNAPYIAKPVDLDQWSIYLNKEITSAISQGNKSIRKQGLVIAINRNGVITRRGVGLPPWKLLIDEMDKKK